MIGEVRITHSMLRVIVPMNSTPSWGKTEPSEEGSLTILLEVEVNLRMEDQ